MTVRLIKIKKNKIILNKKGNIINLLIKKQTGLEDLEKYIFQK